MVSLLCTLFLTAGVQTLAVSKQFGNKTHAWWGGSGPSGSHSQYLHNTRPHGSSVTKGDQIDGRQASAGKWANSREYGTRNRPLVRNFRPLNAEKKSIECENNHPIQQTFCILILCMCFHTNKLQEVICMINYHKILEMHLQGISQRTISSSTGHSRDKIREVVKQAKAKGLEKLTGEMTNFWLEDYLFPEKNANQRGYFDPEWAYIHKELLKKNVTLKLLHKEYEHEARMQNKVPYAYRTFCEKYGQYGKKYKLTMPIHRKPGEILEVDWAGKYIIR